MTKYEVLYIISPALSEEERTAIIEKFKTYKNGVISWLYTKKLTEVNSSHRESNSRS